MSKVPIVNINASPKLIPVVRPPSLDKSSSGRIVNVSVRMVDSSGWLMDDGEGGWALTPALYNKGFRLLEQLYTEENNSAGWKKYKQYLQDWQKGTTTASFPGHLLPDIVQRMQRGEVDGKHRDPWAEEAAAEAARKSGDDGATAEKARKR